MNEHTNDMPIDPLADLPPLVAHAAGAISEAICQSLNTMWHREGAAETIDGFLEGKVRFVIRRDSFDVELEKDGTDEEPPPVGGYL